MSTQDHDDVDMIDVSPSQDISVKRRKTRHDPRLLKQASSTFEQELDEMGFDSKYSLEYTRHNEYMITDSLIL